MAKRIMIVQGLDGEVELMTDRVVIYRHGLVNALKYGLNAQREIPLAAISEVVYHPATSMRFGTIEFVRSGRSSDERKSANSMVKFGRKHAKGFSMLKEKTFELIEQIHQRRNS